MKKVFSLMAVIVGLSFAVSGFAQKYPDITVEGLPRVKHKRLDAAYWHLDATLAGYTKVIIELPEVSFRKNWQRDQNRNRGSNRVTADYMEDVREDLARRFVEIFSKELQEKGNYQIVSEPGEEVLLLKPEIIDLDVHAPDLKSPMRSTTYTTSAGRMTLKMDLVDSETQSLIGRVIDRRRAREDSFGRISNSVTNRAEVDRMLRRWAGILRDAMDRDAIDPNVIDKELQEAS